MKNDKAVMDKSKAKNNPETKTAAGNNKTKGAMTDTAPATDKAKARAGRGSANEGTIVSYDEER